MDSGLKIIKVIEIEPEILENISLDNIGRGHCKVSIQGTTFDVSLYYNSVRNIETYLVPNLDLKLLEKFNIQVDFNILKNKYRELVENTKKKLEEDNLNKRIEYYRNSPLHELKNKLVDILIINRKNDNKSEKDIELKNTEDLFFIKIEIESEEYFLRKKRNSLFIRINIPYNYIYIDIIEEGKFIVTGSFLRKKRYTNINNLINYIVKIIKTEENKIIREKNVSNKLEENRIKFSNLLGENILLITEMNSLFGKNSKVLQYYELDDKDSKSKSLTFDILNNDKIKIIGLKCNVTIDQLKRFIDIVKEAEYN